MNRTESSTLVWIEKYGSIVFFILLLLVLVDRTNTLVRFAFIYTDSDQAVMWLATKDMAAGEFHGFCFYGQSYNPLIEPLLAIPLVKAGLSYPIALPIITSILAVTPFILLAFYMRKKMGAASALLPYIILLLLPPEYGMLTSMPRGFVTGIFFGTLGLLLILRNKNLYDIIGGCLLAFSLFANPNSILLFPLLIPTLFDGAKSFKKRFAFLFAGAVIGFIPQIINSIYYSSHPNLLVHQSPNLRFSLDSFGYIVTHLNIFFDNVSPLLWKFGWVWLVVILLIGIKLKRSNKKFQFYSVFTFLFLMLLTFFIHKVADGRDSVFFSGGRMYLALPILLVFIVGWLFKVLKPSTLKIILCFEIFVSIISFSIKLIANDYFVQQQMKSKDYTVVGISKVEDLKGKCNGLLNFSKIPPTLIVANSANSSDQLIIYGCGCLIKDFSITMQPKNDRRTWLVADLMNKRMPTVLIFGEEIKAWTKIKVHSNLIINKDLEIPLLLIRNEDLTNKMLSDLNIIH